MIYLGLIKFIKAEVVIEMNYKIVRETVLLISRRRFSHVSDIWNIKKFATRDVD